jgi:broad specificity phosphatase PhoE
LISSNEDVPQLVFSSPFRRCVHTGHIVASSLPSQVLKIEEGLTEWFIPSLLVDSDGVQTYPKPISELFQKYGTIDCNYKSCNAFTKDFGIAEATATQQEHPSPFRAETEDDLLKRCATTLQRLLNEVTVLNESFVIVSHAPCDQALAFYLEGSASPAESDMGPWPLGGVTKFSRNVLSDGTFSEWSLEFYGRTSHMPGDYQSGMKHWSLPSFE